MRLIEQKKRKTSSSLKTITFRLEKELVEQFKALSKELGIKQATIIRNAIKISIAEMEEEKNDR
jgi:predicted DNA-binding protein